jgi:uncharacterized protein YjbJ (UPF0337 family)
MDRDQMEGRGREMAGKGKEMAGKVTGDEELENEGKGDQMRGKFEKTAGDIKEKAKDLGDKVRGK